MAETSPGSCEVGKNKKPEGGGPAPLHFQGAIPVEQRGAALWKGPQSEIM